MVPPNPVVALMAQVVAAGRRRRVATDVGLHLLAEVRDLFRSNCARPLPWRAAIVWRACVRACLLACVQPMVQLTGICSNQHLNMRVC
jgi:hypothetical protein